MRRLGAVLASAIVAAGCHSASGPLVSRAPLWEDPDRRPFSPKPDKDPPTLLADGSDQLFFRPLAQLLAVKRAEEAADVNAMDEVPTSSWFTNRIGLLPMSPEDVAVGPCTDPPLDPEQPMVVEDSKLDGITPGFVVKAADGKKYLFKLDDIDQSPRPTAADAIGARIYYAAGFTTPCNRVVFFDRAKLSIAPHARLTTWTGKKRPFEPADLDLLLTHGSRLADGRYRVLASQWLAGKPIGPWRYQDVRSDDPNDVVPHEDRREVRATRLLAAWLDHTDSRAQNTLDMWMTAEGGRGWVRHAVIDFSDCLGTLWEPAERGRQMGNAYWFDVGLIASDFLTLGIRTHPWEDSRYGPSGRVLAWYDVEHFDPEGWKMEIPNPAFSNMSERDGAWMARIIAQFTDAHVERVVRTGRLGSTALEEELSRTIRGRRDRILRRYFSRVSPLGFPTVRRGQHGLEACARDLALFSGTTSARAYAASADGTALGVTMDGSLVCVALPSSGPNDERIVRVDVAAVNEPHAPGPLRLYVRLARGAAAIVGVERPEAS